MPKASPGAATMPPRSAPNKMTDSTPQESIREQLEQMIQATQEPILNMATDFTGEAPKLEGETIIQSDQLMPDGKPQKLAVVPNWCIHKIECNARNMKPEAVSPITI